MLSPVTGGNRAVIDFSKQVREVCSAGIVVAIAAVPADDLGSTKDATNNECRSGWEPLTLVAEA